MTGHLLGAVGAIEEIAWINAVQNNILSPTMNSGDIESEYRDIYNLTLYQSPKGQ